MRLLPLALLALSASAQTNRDVADIVASAAKVQVALDAKDTIIADLRAQLAQAQTAQQVELAVKCPTCVAQMLAGIEKLALPTGAQVNAVVICCGPTTVPATLPGTQIIVLQAMPAAPTDPVQVTGGTGPAK